MSLATATDVQKSYLAYFGRPADVIGLNYWIGQDSAVMNAGFAASQEYANLYSGMTAAQRVEQVYQNLLGRASDTAGKAYWMNALSTGTESISSLVTSMQANAQGLDAVTIANRTTYAIKFTASLDTQAKIQAYAGDAVATAARAAVSPVTYTDASLVTALANLATDVASVNAGVSPAAAAATAAAAAAAATAAAAALYGTVNGAAASSSILTGSGAVDTIVGGTANNTINGGGGADNLSGGTGDDDFQFTGHTNLAAAASVNGTSGADKITITAAALDLVDADFANVTNMDTLTLTGASSVVLGSNANTAGIATVITGAGGTTVILEFNAITINAAALATNAFLVPNSSFGSLTTVTGMIGSLACAFLDGNLAVTLGSDTVGHAVALEDLVRGNVTVTGGNAADTTTVTGLATASQTFSASASASIFNITAGANNQTITGSSTAANTITGGAGADTMTGGAGVDTYVIGATDSLNTALDTISNFAAGTDILDLAVTTAGTYNVASAAANLSTAVAVASTGTTSGTLATDIATAVAAQIGVNANFWANLGDTIVVTLTGASVAGTGVIYVVQNQAANATYDAAADTVVALIGTSTAPSALATVL